MIEKSQEDVTFKVTIQPFLLTSQSCEKKKRLNTIRSVRCCNSGITGSLKVKEHNIDSL